MNTSRRVDQQFRRAGENIVDDYIILSVNIFNRKLHLLWQQDLDLVEVDEIWLNIDTLTKESSSSWTFTFSEI